MDTTGGHQRGEDIVPFQREHERLISLLDFFPIVADVQQAREETESGQLKIWATSDDVNGRRVYFRITGRRASVIDYFEFLGYVSRIMGNDGNDISIRYMQSDPGSAITVVVEDKQITVNLGTAPVGAFSAYEDLNFGLNATMHIEAKEPGSNGNDISLVFVEPDEETEETTVGILEAEGTQVQVVLSGLPGTYEICRVLENGIKLTRTITGIHSHSFGTFAWTEFSWGDPSDGSYNLNYPTGATVQDGIDWINDNHPGPLNVVAELDVDGDGDALLIPSGSPYGFALAQAEATLAPGEDPNSALTWYAGRVYAGTEGNDVSEISYVESGSPGHSIVFGGNTEFTFDSDVTAEELREWWHDAHIAQRPYLEVALAPGSDGSGLLSAMDPVPLSGGLDAENSSLTSTAEDVKNAIENTLLVDQTISASHTDGSDGSGLIHVLEQSYLSNGSDGGEITSEAGDVKIAIDDDPIASSLVAVVLINNSVMDQMETMSLSGGSFSGIFEYSVELDTAPDD